VFKHIGLHRSYRPPPAGATGGHQRVPATSQQGWRPARPGVQPS